MKILIACEYSGRARDAFIAKGHDVMSCDLLPTESPGPHYQGDVMDIINDGWDMMIAFPPCTYVARVAIIHNHKPGRLELREKAIEFFLKLWKADIEEIAIENPRMQKYAWQKIGKWDQVIQPYYFGDPYSKTTLLWLKKLSKLVHSPADTLFSKSNYVDKGEFYKNTNKRTNSKWLSNNKKDRDKTFPGIANAMAEQWG
ncbi:MAG TPA: hypothetical protein ENH82_05645 [bacterium]|nr:hypothetical protein [bacterium]